MPHGPPGRPPAARVEETRLLMGTIANLTVISADPDRGRLAIVAAFGTMERLEGVLSRFLPDSQVSRLNQDGRLDRPDDALQAVLARALEYAQLTGGAFDVSVEPLLAAYRRSAASGASLPEMERRRLISAVDYRAIELQPGWVRFKRPGMAVTLDGIAKGYVIDEGTRALRERGLDGILVEVGGDLMCGSQGDGPWRVGIQAPRATGEGQRVGIAVLYEGAMASSGDYLNAFTQDYRLHHILDPRWGVSPAELASTCVVAPTAMDADALSTSLMVLGFHAGLKLVERLPGVEALLVGKDQRVAASSGFTWEPA